MAEEDAIKLKEGDVVEKRWKVLKKLGQGAFGAVYEVKDIKGHNKGVKALKCEPISTPDPVLKIEVAVLNALSEANLSKHTCTMYACGKTNTISYMVMSLLGQSLNNLLKKAKNKKFGKETCMVILYNAKEALKNLHTSGWLHRDVKPSNFAIAGPNDTERKRTLFLFDFGLSRMYKMGAGKLRPVRDRVGFRGTLRYVSLNGHKGKELGRQDDLLSSIYLVAEMFHGELPWKKLDKPADVQISKEHSTHKLLCSLHAACPDLYDYLHTLTYEDTPEYAKFDETIGNIIDVRRVEQVVPDWDTTATPSSGREMAPNAPRPSEREGEGPTTTKKVTKTSRKVKKEKPSMMPDPLARPRSQKSKKQKKERPGQANAGEGVHSNNELANATPPGKSDREN